MPRSNGFANLQRHNLGERPSTAQESVSELPGCNFDATDPCTGWRLIAAWTLCSLLGWGLFALVVVAVYEAIVWLA